MRCGAIRNDRSDPIDTMDAKRLDNSKIILGTAILLLASFDMPSALAATDPIFESLQYRQEVSYLEAAPSGDDQPIADEIGSFVVTPVADEEPEEESKLELEAADLASQPSLAETRQTQALQDDLRLFGHELFRQLPTTFTPVRNVPVPGNYIIGPGDNLIIQLFGKRNVEYNLVVTRESRLLIPEFGPLQVGGLTFDEARNLIVTGFEQRAIGANAVVTMGELRTLQIRLTGDVIAPGTYTVNGLTTLVDALLTLGGIRPSGSLRNIRVIRDGALIATLDLYDLLLRGDAGDDIGLRHNDVIFVPPLGEIVYIGGEVQRPAIYELDGEGTLAQVLALAGGMLPTASIADSHIERISPAGYKTIIDLGKTALTTQVRSGDFVRILSTDEYLDDVVVLSGHVRRPGAYEWTEGLRASDLLRNASQLLRNADLEFAVIKREHPYTRRTEVFYLDLDDLVNPRDDVLLPRDELIIFDLGRDRSEQLSQVIDELEVQATAYDPAPVFDLAGHSRFTGRFPLQRGIRLLDAMWMGGGIRHGVDGAYAMIVRQRISNGELRPIEVSLAAAMLAPDSGANPEIQAGDHIYLFNDSARRQEVLQSELDGLEQQAQLTRERRIVHAVGMLRSPGDFPLTTEMRASDLVCAAAGATLDADGLIAELSRYKEVAGDPQISHLFLDAAYLIDRCEQRRRAAAEVLDLAARDILTRRNQVVQTLPDVIDPIRFEFGKADVSLRQVARLQQQLEQYARPGHEVVVVLTGHTDSIRLTPDLASIYGTNYGLSMARAQEVAMIIHERIPTANIETRGEGEFRPIATNSTDEGRRLNRRVEVSIEVVRHDPPLDLAFADDARLDPATRRVDDPRDPILQPSDQLAFAQRPDWTPIARIELAGEVMRPGFYVIDRNETLCKVVERAGGLTRNAWSYGAYFTRRSALKRQQDTLDAIQDQIDDLMVDLSISHSANNAQKTPSSSDKDEFYKVFQRLQRAKPTGREVINLDRALRCDRFEDIVLEDGDRLEVPLRPRQVTVMGQVYVPTSHRWEKNRSIRDYIELSGGETVLGREQDAYAVLANGEVVSIRRGLRGGSRFHDQKPEPGAMIYVPLDVDRINTTERIQAWTRSIFEVAVLAGIVL